jgi:hypothetical protein
MDSSRKKALDYEICFIIDLHLMLLISLLLFDRTRLKLFTVGKKRALIWQL